jgi:hypothetical protein
MVWELELMYGANYTEAFAFKQLAPYVHYEALDVYEQHSPKILGIIQIPNLAYAIAIPPPPPCKLPLHIMGLCPII